ncbi:MAG: hypothetical protein AAB910_01250 [Patescibacteria group bacterium]
MSELLTYIPMGPLCSKEQRVVRDKMNRIYGHEQNEAMRSPSVAVLCRQRYTFRERIAKLMGKKFVPTHPRLTVTFFDVWMGFLWETATE